MPEFFHEGLSLLPPSVHRQDNGSDTRHSEYRHQCRPSVWGRGLKVSFVALFFKKCCRAAVHRSTVVPHNRGTEFISHLCSAISVFSHSWMTVGSVMRFLSSSRLSGLILNIQPLP